MDEMISSATENNTMNLAEAEKFFGMKFKNGLFG